MVPEYIWNETFMPYNNESKEKLFIEKMLKNGKIKG